MSTVHPWDTLQQAARHVVSELAPVHPRDDVTLLLARMIGYRKGDTATLRLAARYDAPARARAQVFALLTQWRISDATRDKVVLLVSELVTNAVRFAAGPITVRLIRAGNGLLCEVGDTGNGRPRLKRGDLLDDGGRGLSIVHRLTTRWGCAGRTPGRSSGRKSRGEAAGVLAVRGSAAPFYSHCPSRAVAVRPGAAAYRTARLPGFCFPASCARRRMSNTAAPPRLPLV